VIVGWSPEHTTRAKELLYRCLEQLEATKAALYLTGDSGGFELAASYGFGRRDSLAATIGADHPYWDWVRRHRTVPSFQNEPEGAALRNYLELSSSARFLTVPLAAEERLVGFIDARDKARRAPYGTSDVAIARTIAAAIEELFAEFGLFGATRKEAPAAVSVVQPAPAGATGALHASVVADLAAVLHALASLPGLGTLALTVADGATTRTVTFGRAALESEQRAALTRHQSDLLLAAGCRASTGNAWDWQEDDRAGDAGRWETIHTAVLHTGPPAWIALSALTTGEPGLWPPVLRTVTRHLATAQALRDYRLAARNLARTLLEPGETSFPQLRQHSQTVSELAQRMALLLSMSPADEELVTVAGYLHDVGMRELEYARIYRMPRPGDAERRLYMRHPQVGSRIVEGTAFPGDLAGAIRHHHERWDGNGYPQQLSGEQIPLPSRIIHLAEVYDTLTSRSSYKPAIGREPALAAIRAEAGAQFDATLVPVLVEAVGA